MLGPQAAMRLPRRTLPLRAPDGNVRVLVDNITVEECAALGRRHQRRCLPPGFQADDPHNRLLLQYNMSDPTRETPYYPKAARFQADACGREHPRGAEVCISGDLPARPALSVDGRS